MIERVILYFDGLTVYLVLTSITIKLCVCKYNFMIIDCIQKLVSKRYRES